MNDLMQRKNETADEYMSRLEAMDTRKLRALEQVLRRTLLSSLQAGRERERTRPPMLENGQLMPSVGSILEAAPLSTPSALDQAKTAARRLEGEDRQRFVLWVADGMRDEGGEQPGHRTEGNSLSDLARRKDENDPAYLARLLTLDRDAMSQQERLLYDAVLEDVREDIRAYERAGSREVGVSL